MLTSLKNFVALPITRLMPRGKHLAYNRLVSTSESWRASPRRHRVLYDRTIGAYVPVDLADEVGRMHFFYGTFYLPVNRLLIQQVLGPGDTYIDIGAHHGIFSLTASRVVGPTGQVLAFEPNPESFRRVEVGVAINGIGNVRAWNLALSDEPGTISLSQPEGADSSCCTLRPGVASARSVEVQVARGDAVIPDLPEAGRVLVKVDTEGHELRAVKGLGRLLDRPRMALFIEVTGTWIREFGGSPEELFALLEGHGFKAYQVEKRWQGLRQGLEITPMAGPRDEFQYDVLFSKDDFLPPALAPGGTR